MDRYLTQNVGSKKTRKRVCKVLKGELQGLGLKGKVSKRKWLFGRVKSWTM